MADIVLAIGTSHSPLLGSPPADYPKHAAIDASGRKLLDKNGKHSTYGGKRPIRPSSTADRAEGARGAFPPLHRKYCAAVARIGRCQA